MRLMDLDLRDGDILKARGDKSYWRFDAASKSILSTNSNRPIRVDQLNYWDVELEARRFAEETNEKKGALLLAEHNGEDIEWWDSTGWSYEPFPAWENKVAYRVRPGPVREHVTLQLIHNSNGWAAYQKAAGYTAIIEFDTVDGQLELGSVSISMKED